MMGKQNTEPVLFSYQVNLDTRVRADHPLRKIKEKIDFSFARRQVVGCYGKNGNASVDPEVILKMMFLLFYEDVSSERELMRIIPERLDWMWFLGYGLDDKIPDHSVLSKARTKWGSEVFERLFVKTIHRCLEEGLVGGDKIHLDSSLVAADASKNSILKGGPELIAALKRLYRDQEQKLTPEAGEEDRTPVVNPSDSNKANAGLVSTTDPQAAVVRHGNTDSRPRYKSHRAVDDVYGVITAVDTTPGDVSDPERMMDLVDQHEANTGQAVRTTVADAGYGTVDNFQKCFHRGIESHMADRDQKAKGKGSRKDIFDETRFQYDPQTDTYRCPAGQGMTLRRHKTQRQAREYTAGEKVCRACPLRDQCTRSVSGRSIKRHEDQEAIDAARIQSYSLAARIDRRRRKHLIEGSFADAANNHHFKRSRWRGLTRQKIQDFLIAAAQNIRMLLRHRPTVRLPVDRRLPAKGMIHAFLLFLTLILTEKTRNSRESGQELSFLRG